MSDFRPAKKRVEVTVGESVRIIRDLQGMSQNDLSKASGIPQSTISAIENDRINLGVERAMPVPISSNVIYRARDTYLDLRYR